MPDSTVVDGSDSQDSSEFSYIASFIVLIWCLSRYIGSQLLMTPGRSSKVSEPEGCDIRRLLAEKIDLKQMSRSAIYQILTSEPNTDSSSYPRTQQTPSSPYLRQFQPEWVQSFPWLHYSRHTDGAFCRACALFAPSDVKGQKLGYFVTKSTGEGLSKAILHWLDINELPVADMRGQCYDGASSMAGSRAGCQALIQKECPKALYVHCSSHKLNLAIVSACKISAFKNTESYIGEISRFFAYSAKRQRLLDKAIESIESSTRAKKLKDVCRTRWVQRIDSYIVFEELLPAVHIALKAMVNSNAYPEFGTNWAWDGETTTKARGFLYQLESSTFLVCFQILLKILYYLREITVKLQMQAIDVLCAYDQIITVVTALQKIRHESETEFEKIH